MSRSNPGGSQFNLASAFNGQPFPNKTAQPRGNEGARMAPVHVSPQPVMLNPQEERGGLYPAAPMAMGGARGAR